jgi:hypothetical protein
MLGNTIALVWDTEENLFRRDIMKYLVSSNTSNWCKNDVVEKLILVAQKYLAQSNS